MTNVLEFLTEPAKATEAFHGILYGPSGVGKTSTLDDPNLKVLIIDMEGGSAVLAGAENVKRFDIPEMTRRINEQKKAADPNAQEQLRYETFIQVGKAIEAGQLKEFDLIAPDSFTAFEDAVKEYVALKYAPNRAREIKGKFGAKSDWGDLADLMAKTVRWFHSFTKRGELSQHVMWIAHVLEVKDEDTNKVLTTKIQLSGSKTPDVIMSIADGFFYMYNKQVQVGTTGEGEDAKPVMGIERGILTQPVGWINAKARQPKRMEALPTKIVNPVWSEIFNQLGYVRQ